MVKLIDKRWDGKWHIASDLDELFVFPIVPTFQWPDIVFWNEESDIVHLLEPTVPWESNIYAAEERKELRYENLLTECEKQGWSANQSHLGGGARDFVDRKLLNLSRREMDFTALKARN